MIADINRLIDNKKASVSEIVSQYIKRIELKDGEINSFISRDFDYAMKIARELDDKLSKGYKKPALGGIPMSVKDNISVKGYKMSCGSKMLDNYYPPYTATAVNLLLENDAVLLGKNNMDEFAMGSTGETSYYGVIRNPLDNSKIAGGSSGGSAASVASGMSAYALGSDTGGSARLPASYCGCVGFKPSYGAISRYGLAAYASSFDQIGIIAQSACDAGLIFDAVSRIDDMDMTSCQADDFNQHKESLKGVRIGVDIAFVDYADEDIKKTFYKALDKLKMLGAELVEIKLPECEEVLASYYIIACGEAASNLSRYDGTRYGYRPDEYSSFDDMVIKSRSTAFGDEVKKRIILGNLVLNSGYKDKYYANAVNCRVAVTREINKLLSSVDIIATPCSPKKVPRIGALKASIDEMYLLDIYTVLANLCSLPAISLPCGMDNEGMPVGLQLMSARYADRYLLSLAKIMEKLVFSGGEGCEQ